MIGRTLAKNRTKRYNSARELVADLKDLKLAPSAGVSIARLIRQRRVTIPALLVVIGLTLLITWDVRRSARVQWARETIPEIIHLAAKGEDNAAFALARQVEHVIPNDPALLKLW